jgi:hypothetical protein
LNELSSMEDRTGLDKIFLADRFSEVPSSQEFPERQA